MITKLKARFKPWLQPISATERLIIFVSLSVFSFVLAIVWNWEPAPLIGAAVLALLALWTVIRSRRKTHEAI